MVEKKSIKIFAVGAAAVALVIGLSVGITQSNKSRSTNANYSMSAEDVSQYECVESTAQGSGKSGKGSSVANGSGSKSGKSAGGRRMIVPGTEDYQRDKIHTNQRRFLASELLRTRGMDSRKLGKETVETDEWSEPIVDNVVDAELTGSSGDGVEAEITGASGDGSGSSVDVMKTSGSASGGSKSGKSSSVLVGKGFTSGSGSKSGKSSSTSSVKECAPVKTVCGSNIESTGGKSGKSNAESTGGKSNKSNAESTGGKSNKSELSPSSSGGSKSSKAESLSAPTMDCAPAPTPDVPVVEVATENPTNIITPEPTPMQVEDAITPSPTPAPVTPEPTDLITELITPMPVTPEPMTPEPTDLITELITPMPVTPAPIPETPAPETPVPVPEVVPTPFPTIGASVGSTPTVAAFHDSAPGAQDGTPRIPI